MRARIHSAPARDIASASSRADSTGGSAEPCQISGTADVSGNDGRTSASVIAHLASAPPVRSPHLWSRTHMANIAAETIPPMKPEVRAGRTIRANPAATTGAAVGPTSLPDSMYHESRRPPAA